ncbi:hypothetical protein [Thioalkalivibrio sp. ALJT]|uniref:hypothetical protein n=1 Tax=Thioalkalivibrio sp. ALJT TaxID=1158146 RepID=UPI00035ECCB6|nr:hypothetical protein [Thioalkalivibrio sp. ALJT]
MSSEQQDPRPDTSKESLDARGRNRRRLGKAALGTAPVLMTLHAAPLKAAGANCMPSGWVSGNTSRHDQPEDCGGEPSGYWGAADSEGNPDFNSPAFVHHSGWRDVVEQGGEFVSEHGFPDITNVYLQPAESGGNGGSVDEVPLTLFRAVSDPGSIRALTGVPHERDIIRLGVAALLNARHTSGYPLTEMQVRRIVTATLNQGFLVANSGDRLEPEQVKAFLENTMGTPTWGP